MTDNTCCIRCWDKERKEVEADFIYRGFSICRVCIVAIEKWETKNKKPWEMHLDFEVRKNAKVNTDTIRRKAKANRRSGKPSSHRRVLSKDGVSGRRGKNVAKKSNKRV